MKNDRRRVRMKVALYCLKEELHFPPDAEIIGIEQVDSEMVEMYVTCPSFPEVLPGQESPLINPTYMKHASLVELVDWGFPKPEKKNMCQTETLIKHKCVTKDMRDCKGFLNPIPGSGTCFHYRAIDECTNEEMW